jgi:hypothetical protein
MRPRRPRGQPRPSSRTSGVTVIKWVHGCEWVEESDPRPRREDDSGGGVTDRKASSGTDPGPVSEVCSRWTGEPSFTGHREWSGSRRARAVPP